MSLNLSKFKKVSEDHKSTTLEHPDGHTIIVALGALSPKMKEELKQLPKVTGMKTELKKLPPEPGYTEPKKYAEGTPDEPVSQDEDAPRAPLPDTASEMPAAPAQDMDQNSPAQVQDAPAQSAVAPESKAASPAAPAAISAAPAAPAAAATGQMGPPSPTEHIQSQISQLPSDQQKQVYSNIYNDHAQKFAADLMNNHIEPKTIGDLMGKGTFGKIGGIFGMIMAGAGAGLAHQPNMLMELMQKQIDNDLQAQKANVSNKQNLYQLTMQHDLNESAIAKQQADVLMQQAQMSKIPQEKEMLKAQAQNLYATANKTEQERQLDVTTNANNTAMQAAFHSLLNSPAGQTPQGQQTLAMMYQGMQKSIISKNDAAAGAKALMNMLGGGNNTPQPPALPQDKEEQDFGKQIHGLRVGGGELGKKIADERESKHIPGVQGQASMPVNQSTRDQINKAHVFRAQMNDFMNWTKSHSGDLNPADYQEGLAKAANLQAAYRDNTNGGVFKEGEQNFISKIIDSDPTKFFNKVRVMPGLKAVADDNETKLNAVLKTQGFPTQKSQSQSAAGKQAPQKAGPVEGSTATSGGKPIIFRNGKWGPK